MALYYLTEASQVVAIDSASSPGAGWVSAANLQAILNQARTSNLPLFLRPGTYATGALSVTAGTGGGNPLSLRASPGTVTIRLNAAATQLLLVDGVPNATIEGIVFDGNNKALSGGSPKGVVRFSGTNTTNFLIRNCRVINSTKAGIAIADDATGRVLENTISNSNVGIFANDSTVIIENNKLDSLTDNGICVWTSSITGNGSQVVGNLINGVTNVSGGTGEYGNGILVFRAGDVKVIGNTTYNVNYSGVRVNASVNSQVSENYCWNSREVAIFIEAPAAGLDLIGCVITNNVITIAGTGISVANAGLYGDGVAKRCVVSNNVISDITNNAIPDPGYSPPTTGGTGVSVEVSCNVIGNTIENTEGSGISLGTNDAAENLAATGNLIINSPMGIGYSANSAARAILISSNLIRGYREVTNVADPNYGVSGAIVSQSFDGTSFTRDKNGSSPNTDYGNSTQTTSGALTVGMNQAS